MTPITYPPWFPLRESPGSFQFSFPTHRTSKERKVVLTARLPFALLADLFDQGESGGMALNRINDIHRGFLRIHASRNGSWLESSVSPAEFSSIPEAMESRMFFFDDLFDSQACRRFFLLAPFSWNTRGDQQEHPTWCCSPCVDT